MLTRLKISNIALIDKSDIVFDAGFSALTGETGAGKSILIESVSFVLGDRSSRDSIRTGASKASAEADFVLNNDSRTALSGQRHTLFTRHPVGILRLSPNNRTAKVLFFYRKKPNYRSRKLSFTFI